MPIHFGKQANDIHVGIIGYQVSTNPFSPVARDDLGSSGKKARPGTTKNNLRGVSNTTPTIY
jgi:hypothetical protein